MFRSILTIFLLSRLVEAAPQPLGSSEPAGLGDPQAEVRALAIDPAILKLGKQQFITCAACHGQAGEGTGAGPPLAGSEWVIGPVENLIRIQLRGLQGPIKVKGVEYNFPAGMAALAYQTDEQIAAVLTYIRNSNGNSATAVIAAEVNALRSEVGKPALTIADLISPFPATADSTTVISAKYDNLPTQNRSKLWFSILSLSVLGLVTFFILKKRAI